MMTNILTPPHIQLSNVRISDSPLQPPLKRKVASLCLKRRKEVVAEMENAVMTATWPCVIVDEMKLIVCFFLAETLEPSPICAGSIDDFYHWKGSRSMFSSCLYKIPSLTITEHLSTAVRRRHGNANTNIWMPTLNTPPSSSSTINVTSLVPMTLLRHSLRHSGKYRRFQSTIESYELPSRCVHSSFDSPTRGQNPHGV
jgi:hypothetical protein